MLYAVLQMIFPRLFRLICKCEVIGAENIPCSGAVILAGNHVSNWDPPVMASFTPRVVSYMAKEELFKMPLFGTIIRSLHAFPVRRGAADRSAIKGAIALLKAGGVLGMFPEGTRSRTGALGKAETGIALIAAKSAAVVVPAALSGTDRLGWNSELRVIYGKPLTFDGDVKNREELDSFSQQVMEEIRQLKELAAGER